MTIQTRKAPKPPVDPADYTPSVQVRHVIAIIAETRFTSPGLSWSIDEGEQRQQTGYRHGQAVILRALVELETRITDSDTLDQLIGDMMEEATSWRG